MQDYPSKLLYINTSYTHTEIHHLFNVCDVQDYHSKLQHIYTGYTNT